MANSLGRNLKVGDRVVLNGGIVAEIAADTFGCVTFTSGTALGVKIGGEQMRVDGYDIDKKATESRFASANGWTQESP